MFLGRVVLTREDLVACFLNVVAPLGVRPPKAEPSHIQGIPYVERNCTPTQRLDTVVVAIQQVLSQYLMVVYAKKGCHCIETRNGRSLH